MYKEKEQQNQIFASCKSLLNFFRRFARLLLWLHYTVVVARLG